MCEYWKSIVGYEGFYEASNTGHIRRCSKLNEEDKKILSQSPNSAGYGIVILSKNGESKTYRAHRVVAGTFLPNPNNMPFVNHKDGNKLNNSIKNLEWITAEGNTEHAIVSGLTSKNKKIKILKKGKEIGMFYSIRRAAEFIGVDNSHLSKKLKKGSFEINGYTLMCGRKLEEVDSI